MIRLAAKDHEAFFHMLGLFAEVGVSVDQVHGGNEFSVPDGTVVDDNDVRLELARMARAGTLPAEFAPHPPGGGDPAPPAPAAATQSQPVVAAGPAGQADLPLPPKTGPGSSRAAWATAAHARGVSVNNDMTRDDLIKLVEAHSGS
jgi:hypothetical protein